MQKNIQILTKKEIQAYIRENCTRVRPGFYRVDKPLKVWKKTLKETPQGTIRGIVALEIPVGATIHTLIFNGRYNGYGEDQAKMRANVAIVRHQCVISNTGKWTPAGYLQGKDYVLKVGTNFTVAQETVAAHDDSFKYITGQSVKPKPVRHGWDAFENQGACQSGIHFFVNLSTALSY